LSLGEFDLKITIEQGIERIHQGGGLKLASQKGRHDGTRNDGDVVLVRQGVLRITVPPWFNAGDVMPVEVPAGLPYAGQLRVVVPDDVPPPMAPDKNYGEDWSRTFEYHPSSLRT